jgi:hypothetical protein
MRRISGSDRSVIPPIALGLGDREVKGHAGNFPDHPRIVTSVSKESLTGFDPRFKAIWRAHDHLT